MVFWVDSLAVTCFCGSAAKLVSGPGTSPRPCPCILGIFLKLFFTFIYFSNVAFFLCSLSLSSKCRQTFRSLKTQLLKNCFQCEDFQKTPFYYLCVCTGNWGFCWHIFSHLLSLYSSVTCKRIYLERQATHAPFHSCVPFPLISRFLIGQRVLWGFIATPWFPMRSSICDSINSHLRWVAFNCTNGLKTRAGGSNIHSNYHIRRRKHVNVAGSRWVQGRGRKKGRKSCKLQSRVVNSVGVHLMLATAVSGGRNLQPRKAVTHFRDWLF